jgi:hypothetical protein
VHAEVTTVTYSPDARQAVLEATRRLVDVATADVARFQLLFLLSRTTAIPTCARWRRRACRAD